MTMAWTYAQILFLASVALSIVFLVASEMLESKRHRRQFSVPPKAGAPPASGGATTGS